MYIYHFYVTGIIIHTIIAMRDQQISISLSNTLHLTAVTIVNNSIKEITACCFPSMLVLLEMLSSLIFLYIIAL